MVIHTIEVYQATGDPAAIEAVKALIASVAAAARNGELKRSDILAMRERIQATEDEPINADGTGGESSWQIHNPGTCNWVEALQ